VTRQRLRVFGRIALLGFVGVNALAVSGQSRAPDGNRLPAAIYPDVIALYDTQQATSALAALDAQLRNLNAESTPVEALALRAQLLSAGGRHSESAAIWKDVAGREPALRVVALTAILNNQLADDDVQGAQDGLTQLVAASPDQRVDLVLRVAAACRSAGQNDQAATLYRRARQLAGRSVLADEAALGLAAALEASGHPADALDVVRDLRLTFRAPATYAIAVAQAQRLSTALGRSREPVSERDYQTIAERLSAGTDFQQAITVLTEWREAYPDTLSLARIDAAIIENLYDMRANVEASARCALFLDRHPTGPEAAAVRITQFRLDVREGRTASARARGLAIWRSQLKDVTPDDRRSVARLLAEYLVSVGEAKDGLTVYDELYRATPGRSDRIDLLWRSAIAAIRAGRQDRAAGDLRRVLGLNPGAETVRAATYWLASLEDAQGSRDAATGHWMTLVERYPYSYYGVRAADRLGKRSRPAAASARAVVPRLVFPDMSLSASATSHRDYRTAALLARAGLRSEAAAYAVRLSQVFRVDAAAALLAARAAAAAGHHRIALRLATSRFGSYLERPADNLPDDLWSLAYPPAYWNDIQTAARRHGVDPLLMLALMQQESQFDPEARSPAGALGLFQIMPSTAERVRIGLGIDRVDAEDLMQPGVSAEIAARLLSDLVKLFHGELAPAIAAYNAGEDRVQAWWEAARGGPEELFVDSIPYRETRGYVREVLANYFTYRRLNGQ
jgi:soluble lytic murein transglycosylase